MSDENEHFCRVCGYDFEDVPTWVGIFPQYVICNCCGMESGLEDEDLEKVRNYRAQWVANGAHWQDPKAKPSGWDLLSQIANIPKQWR
ncbi:MULTISPECIES: hypothetical protein [unclassified Streptomyces]|uniref:hypothetical protein n=1 Tax=unclassified Streptomyces TaxID=2593676 RepID=UPI003435DDD4